MSNKSYVLEVGFIWKFILGRVFFYLEDIDIRAYFRCSSKSPTTGPSSSRDKYKW